MTGPLTTSPPVALPAVQSQMVFESFAGDGLPHANVSAVRVVGAQPFSVAALERAVAGLVAEDARLRVSVQLTGPEPLTYRTHPGATVPVVIASVGPAGDHASLEAFARTERGNPLGWEAGSWLRVTALREAGDAPTGTDWWLATTWSRVFLSDREHRAFADELLARYRAEAAGTPHPGVAPSATTPSATADWTRRPVLPATAASELPKPPPALALPAAWADRDADAQDWHSELVDLTGLRPGLTALAERAGVGLGSVLHAVHLRVLTTLTHEPSFTTGLALDGSGTALAFAFDAEAAADTADWIELVRLTDAAARSGGGPACPLGTAGSPGWTPVDIVFRHDPEEDPLPPADRFELAPDGFGLSVAAGGTRLRLTSTGRAAGPAALARLAGLYHAVATAMAADPCASADADLLPAGERDLVVRAWNDTQADYPEQLCVHQLFERQVRRDPQAVAVVTADGDTVSYQQLNERANQLAHHLRGLGVGADTFVGICVEHSVAMLVGLLGILKAGGAYVPLDPEHPVDRLRCIVEDTAAPVVVTVSGLQGVLPPGDAVTVLLDRDADLLDTAPTTDPEPLSGPQNLIYAMFTSGSTGRPKGVLVTHQGVVNYLDWAVEGYGLAAGRSGAPMLGSIAFDLSVPNFFLPLIGGKDVTLLRTDRTLDDLAERLCKPGDFSLLKITPAHLDVLRSQIPEPDSVSSVHTFVVGADEVKPETVAAWQRVAPNARIINEYGPTETVVGCSVYEADADFDPSAPVPIGRPIANTQMYVLDRFLNPAPIGAVGELFIGGDGVTRGYLHRPALTAEKFVPDPFHPVPGSRLYRTGDLARFRTDGNLDFLGRIDHQVKVRGYRIELGEIEARLLLHHAVSEAVVAARTDAHGDRCLVAYVVGVDRPGPEAAELRAFLAEALPRYMLPGEFVLLPALPLSTAGKVDRRLLPDPVRGNAADDLSAPATPTERVLAGAWSRALGVSAVGTTEEGLALRAGLAGAARMVALAAEAGLEVPLDQVFRHGSVAELAADLDARTAAVERQSAGSRTTGVQEFPLTAAQQQLLTEADGGGCCSVLIRSGSPIPAPAARAALRALVSRHQALRLRLTDGTDGTGGADGVRQFVAADDQGVALGEVTAGLGLHDDDGPLPAAIRKAAEAEAAAQAAALDPRTGPLLRATLLSGSNEPGNAHWLLLTAPRRAVDAASWRILLDELAAELGLTTRGDTADPADSFEVWARRLAEHANGEQITAELSTWLTPVTARQFPRSGDDGGPGASGAPVLVRTLALDPELTAALLADTDDGGPTAGGRADAVVLAALARTVAVPGTEDLPLLVEVALPGRPPGQVDGVDVSRTVGCFTSRFPLAVGAVGAVGPEADAVRAVRTALRELPADGLGYGLLRRVRADRVSAALAAAPAPRVRYDASEPLDAEQPLDGGLLRHDLDAVSDHALADRPQAELLGVTRRLRGDRLELRWRIDAANWPPQLLPAPAELPERFLTQLRHLVGVGR